jgi:DNA-binding PadR family transcriptional regulator
VAKINKSQFAILGMLSIEPMSGYEIRRNMEDSTNYFWKESDGQLYPTLERLVKEKKITYEGVRRHGARASKVYKITELGHEALQLWLEDPSCVLLIRSEFLLKIFFGANTSNAKIIEHISAFQQQRKQRLQMLSQLQRKMQENPNAQHTFFWELCCLYAEKQLRALVEWSDEALHRLRERQAGL